MLQFKTMIISSLGHKQLNWKSYEKPKIFCYIASLGLVNKSVINTHVVCFCTFYLHLTISITLFFCLKTI